MLEMWLVRAEVRREAEDVVGPVDLQRLRVFSAPQRRTRSTSGEPRCAIAVVARALQTSVALNEREHALDCTSNNTRASAKKIWIAKYVCVFLTSSTAIREHARSSQCCQCLASHALRGYWQAPIQQPPSKTTENEMKKRVVSCHRLPRSTQ